MAQCAFPGCPKPAFPGGLYCSRRHRDAAPNQVKICEYPECGAPVSAGLAYCCADHQKAVPGIVRLEQTDAKYQDVLSQFQKKWLHSTNYPNVQYIFQVLQPRTAVAAYQDYRDEVESRGLFVAKGFEPGNQQRRFHGTKRACSLGNDGSTDLCSFKECCLCGIIKTSFKVSLAGQNNPWHRRPGRFGRGIYTSATSSKANDYSKNLPAGRSRSKAMLLTRIVVGKGEKVTKSEPLWKGPSPGYDSIIGEPDPKRKRLLPWTGLNYDKLVVYKDCAAIPAYLIIYESP
ncbi:hypothetical protein OE88DRAFT_1663074 [Heliocybe sulcata]|uniref:PARP catalytic domain-containing protein n=1 Tax=Heliocybe sulcata TaxID=5364 RepID=A0A5C3MX58_9AGAM|nr:hypothetical protein OE88DRAFT_1663074 [Heliocybe sulcata]